MRSWPAIAISNTRRSASIWPCRPWPARACGSWCSMPVATIRSGATGVRDRAISAAACVLSIVPWLTTCCCYTPLHPDKPRVTALAATVPLQQPSPSDCQSRDSPCNCSVAWCATTSSLRPAARSAPTSAAASPVGHFIWCRQYPCRWCRQWRSRCLRRRCCQVRKRLKPGARCRTRPANGRWKLSSAVMAIPSMANLPRDGWRS